MNSLTIPLTNSETVLPECRVEVFTTTLQKRMTIYVTLMAGGIASWITGLAQGWTSQDWVVVIGAVSTFAAALFAGYIAIINAKTKAKIEEHRAISEENSKHLVEMKSAIKDNAEATKQASKDVQVSVDQAKVRVEELTKVVEEQTPKS